MGSSFVALYQNFASVGGALAGGSWQAGLPLTNLQTSDLGKIARSIGASFPATLFTIDFGVPRPIGGFAIGPTNMSPGSQYRIRSYDDNTMTTVLYDSGVKQLPGLTVDSLDLEWEDPGFWYGIGNSETLDVVNNPWIIEVIPEGMEDLAFAQYWKIEMLDEDNPDGFLEVGYCLAGRAFRPSYNFDEQNAVGRLEMTDSVEALGGRRDYWHRGSRRVLRVNWPYLGVDEGWDDIYRMALALGVREPMFVVPDPSDLEHMQKRAFLASFKQSPEMRLLLEARVSTSFDLEEWL